jgi:LuxR family maltose regulon positive regulatory protein
VYAFKAGDLGRSRELLGVTESSADEFTSAVREIVLAVTAYWSGATDDALHALSAVADRTRGDNPLGTLYSLGYLALSQLRLGDLDACRATISEADQLRREPLVGGHFVAMAAQLAAAQLADLDDDLPTAIPRARQAVELARRGAGRVELAAALALLSHLLRRTAALSEARAASTEARAVAAACLEPGSVLSEALAKGPGAAKIPAQVTPETLTDRELTVLRMLPGNASTRELAAAMFVSPNTVKSHLKAIYRKIGATNREEAVQRAHELGLVAGHKAR